MLNLHTFLKLLGTASLAALLAACVKPGVPLHQGAENVKVINTPAPKGCKFIGEVGSRDENGRNQAYTSHAKIQDIELNRIRNQGLIKGANLIVITDHQTVYHKQSVNNEHFQGEGKLKVLDWHVLMGDAYTCPAAVWNKIPFNLNVVKD